MGDKWIQLRAGRAAVALLLGVFGLTAAADVRISGVFNDDMVLQREMPIPVWGWAAPGESVLVEFSGQQETAVADDFGCWQAVLQPEAANSVGQVLAAGGISITNVLVGEVWLCAGDETMDSRLQKSLNALAEGAAANYPEIRLAQVELANTPLPAKDVTADWRPCSPATAPTFSANGYFFARKLHQELGVPVGVIMATYGVSPIVSWLPAEGFRDTPALQWAVDDIYNSRPSTAEGKARWETYLSDMVAWRPKALAAVAAGEIPVDRPLIPNDLWITANIPTKLFNGEIHPLIPQAMRGVIWAQGVTDRLKPTGYQASQLALIDSWRTLWGQGDFPFYFAQLPRYNDTHPDYITGTPVIREVQRQCLEMTNTGMAVTMDVVAGYQTTDVNSQAVGTRLALWALAGEYGQTNLVYSGPLFSGFEVSGSEVTLQFSHVGSGLMAGYKDGLADTVEVSDPLDTFEMARADGQWFPASAVVAPGGETLTVSSVDVASPVGVRYGYSMDPDGSNLYNREGLPASPFTMINYGLVPEGTLINHVFDGGTEALDGTLVDGGSLQTGSLSWNSHASITADGVISLNNATAADEASAFIDLGGVISQGSSNDIYIFEIVMDNATTDSQPFLSFGLSGSGNIDLTHNNSGSPWASWPASDVVKASTGKPSSGDLHNAGITSAGGFETFTFVLDLRDAALANNTVALYQGATQLGSTASFSGDEGFQYVGIGAKTSGAGQTAAGTIESVKLVKNGSVLSTDYALTVSSPQGASSPNIGTTLVASGTVVNAHVTSPVINGSTQYVATGWAGTGSVSSGSGTNVSFTMANDTALIWLWQTNVYYDIVATAGVGGLISPVGTTTLLSGGDQLYTISPDADFALTYVAVDGGSIGVATEYTFTNVTTAHTIAAAFESTVSGIVLIAHTFDEGAGNLNATTLEINNIGVGTWNAGLVTEDNTVDANGNVSGGNGASAWVHLNGAITMGSPDDTYEVAMIADKLGVNCEFQGGFWGPIDPSKTGQHKWQSGTAFWYWQDGSVTAYAGAGQVDPISGSTALANNTGPTLLTLRLDLTDATLANNSFSLYIGDSATGTLVGSANFSGDESFEELGISGRPTGGQTAGRVTSLTLTREPLAPATPKGSLIMIR